MCSVVVSFCWVGGMGMGMGKYHRGRCFGGINVLLNGDGRAVR